MVAVGTRRQCEPSLLLLVLDNLGAMAFDVDEESLENWAVIFDNGDGDLVR